MTSHRRPDIRFSDAPQGVCRWCGEEILSESGDKQGSVNRRRRWHQPCVDSYNDSDPQEARRRIRKRDRGRCAVCRVDTYKVRRELRKLGRGRNRAIRERGYKPRQSFWELDHIVPLIDGGSHDDENLQTLCTPCHTAKTAAEARARAAGNRGAQEKNAGKPLSRPALSFEEILAAADVVNARVAEALGSPRVSDVISSDNI